MIYINRENPVKITENSSLADRIRGSRRTFQCTEEMVKRTQDIFEKSGCEKVMKVFWMKTIGWLSGNAFRKEKILRKEKGKRDKTVCIIMRITTISRKKYMNF